MAAGIDVRHHAFADKLVIRGFHHFTHEFVPQRAAERIIAANDLKVGVADPGFDDPDQRFARCRHRNGHFIDLKLLVFPLQCLHSFHSIPAPDVKSLS